MKAVAKGLFWTIIQFLVYTNIFVSLCCASLVYQTNVLWSMPLDHRMAALVFLATLLAYNFQRLARLMIRKESQYTTRAIWLKRNIKGLVLLSVIGGVGVVWVAVNLSMRQWELLVPLGLVSLLYAVNLFRINGEWYAPRHLPYIKIFLIVLVWVGATVYLPLLEAPEFSWSDPALHLLGLQRFLMVLAVTLPFDIRDRALDSKARLKTLAAAMGVNNTVRVSAMLLLTFAVTAMIQLYLEQIDLKATMMLLVSAAWTLVVIAQLNDERGPYYYSVVVESTLLVQSLMVLTVLL